MASISHVQKIASTSANGASTIHVSGSTTTGNDIIVMVVFYPSSGTYPTCTVTDGASNSYTNIKSFTGSSTTGPSYVIAQAHNTTGLSSQNVTATFSSGTNPFSIITAHEFAGLSTTLDGSVVTNNGHDAAPTFSALSTSNNNNLILSLAGYLGNFTAAQTAINGSFQGTDFQSATPTLAMGWQIQDDVTHIQGGQPSTAMAISATEYWQTAVVAIEGSASPTTPSYYRLGTQDSLASDTSSAGTYTVNYPAATTSGNLLVAAIVTSTASGTNVFPSGWTTKSVSFRTSYQLRVGWKISTGDSSVVFNSSTGSTRAAQLYEFTGNNATQPDADASVPSSQSNGTSTGTSYGTASLTTDSANDLIMSFVSNDGSGSYLQAPSWSTSAVTGSVAAPSSTYGVTGGTYFVSSTQSGFTDTLSWTGTSTGMAAVTFAFPQGSSSVSASVTQVHGIVTATGGTQSVATIQDSSVSQLAATVTATGGTPSTNVGTSQLAATVTASGGTQTIAALGDVAVSQVAGSVTASGGTQAVATIQDASVAQSAATITATGGTQATATINIAAASQTAASVTASGGTQSAVGEASASVSQSAATITATGGTPTTAIALGQIAATVTATGGTQTVVSTRVVSVSQSAASVTASGGTQAVATTRDVSITQVSASVTATGGTQTADGEVTVTVVQVAATVTATGGTQVAVGESGTLDASVAQSAATVTASGGTQIVTISTSPLPPVRIPNLIFLLDGRLAARISKNVYLPL